MTDESVDTFYSCLLCQSFAPNHVCIITPERLETRSLSRFTRPSGTFGEGVPERERRPPRVVGFWRGTASIQVDYLRNAHH